jgi:hypothetical protein
VSAVIVALRVPASPREAFDIFTQEIALWWEPNPLFELTPRGDGAFAFEPDGAGGGRFVTRLDNGKTYEIGAITAWAPGERLAFGWRPATCAPDQATHVEVRFEAVGEETRVTVEHRGWDGVPQAHAARHGMPLAVFQMRLAEHWRARLIALRARL